MKQIKNIPEREVGKDNSRPTAQDAGRRLMILKRIVVRALVLPPRDIVNQLFEQWPADEVHQFTQTENQDFWRSLRDEGLWQYLSPWEQQFAACTMVTMTHEDQVYGSWQVERVQTLLWALGLLSQLPPYDSMADHNILKMIPSEDPTDFIGSAALRPQAEIDQARDIAECWHWRSRTRELIEDGDVFEPGEILKALGLNSYEDIVRFSAPKLADEGTIPPCIADDFPAYGHAYRDISQEEWIEVRSVSIHRHKTLNWLCGYAPGNRWDETPTDT